MDINCKNKQDNTPLHYAAKANKSAVTELMKSQKIEINCRNDKGDTPLNWASFENNKDAAEELLKHKDVQVNATNLAGQTPHHHAAVYCDAEYLKLLLRHGADLSIKDKSGRIADIPYAVMEELLNGSITMTKSKDFLGK